MHSCSKTTLDRWSLVKFAINVMYRPIIILVSDNWDYQFTRRHKKVCVQNLIYFTQNLQPVAYGYSVFLKVPSQDITCLC
jgi:hypothetical protein